MEQIQAVPLPPLLFSQDHQNKHPQMHRPDHIHAYSCEVQLYVPHHKPS